MNLCDYQNYVHLYRNHYQFHLFHLNYLYYLHRYYSCCFRRLNNYLLPTPCPLHHKYHVTLVIVNELVNELRNLCSLNFTCCWAKHQSRQKSHPPTSPLPGSAYGLTISEIRFLCLRCSSSFNCFFMILSLLCVTKNNKQKIKINAKKYIFFL